MPKTATKTVSPWREVNWTDERNKVVQRLICHEDELAEVILLPFPKGAVVREPVYEATMLAGARFFRRDMTKVGDPFLENINQKNRECEVVAIDPKTWRVLYEYEMPFGTSALRWYEWKNGVMKTGQIAYSRLSKRWLDLIENEGQGLINLIQNPQSGKDAMRKNFNKHGYVTK